MELAVWILQPDAVWVFNRASEYDLDAVLRNRLYDVPVCVLNREVVLESNLVTGSKAALILLDGESRDRHVFIPLAELFSLRDA